MSVVPASDPVAGVLILILVSSIVLLYTIQRLRRTRPRLAIGRPISAAFGIRLLAIIGINSTGLGASLRGGDELTFLAFATNLAKAPLGTAYLPHGIYQLQTVIFALQIKAGFINESGIRVTQICIALLGFTFMLAATHDLGGPRAARLAGWCLAFEPSSIFFNTEIHKEANMELAAGLVALGAVWMWKRLDLRGILICAIGCAIGVYTRGYAGWFLAAGCVLMILHASLRHTERRGLSLALIYAIMVSVLVAAPTVLAFTGGKNLRKLQLSQAQNASGQGQTHANLKLEAVNVSSRGAVITSLPTKIRELLLQPYPWQVSDSSQMFGAVGTLVAYTVLVLLIRYAWMSRGKIFGRAGPLLYPLLFEMVAYAITVGNAGTGFRYRSHLVTLGICALMVLREHVRAGPPPGELTAVPSSESGAAPTAPQPVTA